MESSTAKSPITLSILPLQNLSDDQRIQMFCTGLHMDLMADFARLRSFHIVPMESSSDLPPNVDYLVKGLSRYHDNLLQINLQLINARENRLIWAERFGDTLEHLYQIEEEIIQKIVLSLQQVVDQDLLTSIRNRQSHELSAYESWLYGMDAMRAGTLAADEKARTYFLDAIEKDPSFARAYTGMSLTYFNEWSCLLWDEWDENQQKAIEWALKAVDLDPLDPQNAFILGKCFLFYRQFDKAEYYIQKVIALSPSEPKLLAGLAFCLVYLSQPTKALQLYEEAVRIDPSRNGFILTGTLVYLENKRYHEAIEIGKLNPGTTAWIDFQGMMAAAYYHAGQEDAMWKCWNQFTQTFHRKIRPHEPFDEAIALEWVIDVNPFKGKSEHQSFWNFIGKHLGKTHSSTSETKRTSLPNEFIDQGSVWTLSFGGKSAQIPNLKGLQDIARLLQTPDETLSCADLMGITTIESGVDVLDAKAKKAYQKRLLDIQDAIHEAEEFHDHPTLEKLQKEYDDILHQVSRAVGKGRKIRTSGSSLDKARAAVTWRIRAAIKKIEVVHPELGKHLKNAIKTGLHCSYQPEQSITWHC